ncbi:hypothetical protein Mapa_013268 [Marchantia paleacea]|nr:hypothetical protein Mapa_013268 [Marchantia paleacea]
MHPNDSLEELLVGSGTGMGSSHSNGGGGVMAMGRGCTGGEVIQLQPGRQGA